MAEIKPQDLLMNCIAEAERIQKIVVIVKTNDECYETWSNLDVCDRLGLINIARVRLEKNICSFEDEEEKK